MSLEGFKEFVKTKPNLVDYITSKEMTWQDFYDLYVLYGPNNSIWDKYNGKINNDFSLSNMFERIKNIDMNEFQQGIGSLQKGIGYLKALVKDEPRESRESYEPRSMYKYFDD